MYAAIFAVFHGGRDLMKDTQMPTEHVGKGDATAAPKDGRSPIGLRPTPDLTKVPTWEGLELTVYDQPEDFVGGHHAG